jgi:hypothetical protein
MSTEQMRIALKKAYFGKGWSSLVDAMNPRRVEAEYNRLKALGKVY